MVRGYTDGMSVPLAELGTVTIRIVTPARNGAFRATQAVLRACEPYRISTRTADDITTVTIRTEGWAPVADAMSAARRTGGDGWHAEIRGLID